MKCGLKWAFPLLLALAGCRTPAPLPPANLAEPGWTVRQGQAVWRSDKTAPELAGELLVARQTNGSSLVQFSKNPLPLVVARTTPASWEIHNVPQNLTYAARGAPSPRVGWVLLPGCLAGAAPPKPWTWQARADGTWRLANPATGEFLEGYLNP